MTTGVTVYLAGWAAFLVVANSVFAYRHTRVNPEDVVFLFSMGMLWPLLLVAKVAQLPGVLAKATAKARAARLDERSRVLGATMDELAADVERDRRADA